MHEEARRTWVPELATLMQATTNPFINAIFDREPLHQFVWGRVVLIGEAAHPTTPHGLRSTNMSILDAFVLGNALSKWGSEGIDAALNEYQEERVPATAREVLFSRHLGQLKQGLAGPEYFQWLQADEEVKRGLLQRNMHRFRPEHHWSEMKLWRRFLHACLQRKASTVRTNNQLVLWEPTSCKGWKPKVCRRIKFVDVVYSDALLISQNTNCSGTSNIIIYCISGKRKISLQKQILLQISNLSRQIGILVKLYHDSL